MGMSSQKAPLYRLIGRDQLTGKEGGEAQAVSIRQL